MSKEVSLSSASKPERIAKMMARLGLCSRRQAEVLIEQRRVTFKENLVETPAFFIKWEDAVFLKIDGSAVPVEPPQVRLWRFHKPAGLLTTHHDPHGRPTVFEALPQTMPRVISVGRLDLNSEGLLLLTNHGELSRFLELPSTGWKRRYRVRCFGDIPRGFFEHLQQGVTLDGFNYGPIEASLDTSTSGEDKKRNKWLSVTLMEGKNREIRKVLQYAGLSVSRLIRISYGPFLLGNLSPGEAEEVSQRHLKNFLGNRWYSLSGTG
ncbi:MAG: pseudouridine synthase [Alphaproteobacteria bacterium]